MKTVCIIDDDATFQKMMNQHLTSMGYVVQSIFSGLEVDALPERPYAILLDHHLDDEPENGLAILSKLRKKLPGVPIIYMTSERDTAIKDAALRQGVFDFIEKDPASLVRLRNALDQIAQRATKNSWIRKIFGNSLD